MQDETSELQMQIKNLKLQAVFWETVGWMHLYQIRILL